MEVENKGVVLLDSVMSMFGMRVRIALAMKGVSYEYKEEDLSNKSQLLLKSNPIHKKIPVLLDEGKPICESSIIVQYIDEKWSHNPLLPSDRYLRSQERFWVDYIDKNLYPSGTKIWQTKGDEHEEAKKVFLGHMKLLEGQLEDKAFFGGEKFGFLDVSLVTFSTWFYSWETAGGFKMEEECPKLMAWVERCMQIDTVAKSLPHHLEVYDFFCNVYKKRLGYDD